MKLRLFVLVLLIWGGASSVYADVPNSSVSTVIDLDQKFRSSVSPWALRTLLRNSEDGNANIY
ncbi:MAG: hypothetical protein ACPG6T_06645, partial [Paracoccaceae bacterium]